MTGLWEEGKIGTDVMRKEVEFDAVLVVDYGGIRSYYWKTSASIENEGKGLQSDQLGQSIPYKG